MHDQRVVLGQLDPKWLVCKPFPVLALELFGNPPVSRPELGEWQPGALGAPPPQAVLVVIAASRTATELAHQPHNT
jgi:hypothetical protein